MKFLSKRGVARTAVIVFVLLIVGGNVFFTNQLIERNQPAVSITPGSPTKGEKGDKGDKGDRPTALEVKQAVTDYCLDTGTCEGESPSIETVYAAVTRYCLVITCHGTDGSNGRDAAAVTDAQIQAQVAAYCAATECIGRDGKDGADGANGLPGEAGRSPLLACVIRSSSGVDDRYVAWKYSDEEDNQYKDLYKLPVLAECTNAVDLRT
jgi:hypothetical protein